MSKVPPEEKQRNLEFYKRWRIDGENIYELLKEYGFGFSRAYRIKYRLEEKYPAEVARLSAN
jgi:hypothetical protein